MIEYDLLTSSAISYDEFRYKLFTDLFGTNFRPYVDDNGHPRIGAAIDLVTFMPAAAQAILGSSLNSAILNQLQAVVDQPYSADQTDLLQSRLDQVLDSFRSRSTPLPQVFKFNVAFQAMAVLDAALSSIETKMDSWNDAGVPLSEERAVVASVAHEGYDVTGILDALATGQTRAEAWFEIRYRHGSAINTPVEQAARQYYQSTVFELYNDPGSVDFAEAAEIGRSYTARRVEALVYEQVLDPEQLAIGDLPPGGQERIAMALQPAISAVAAHYFADVQHADELLFVPPRAGSFQGDDVNDTFNDINNDDDFLIGSSSADIVDGADANDVLLGLAGKDRLTGGLGDDLLYGGVGKDRLIGGAGNDTIWGGGERDELEGGSGNDIYVLGSDKELDPDAGGSPNEIAGINSDRIVEGRNGGTDTVIIQVNRGRFDFRHVENFTLAADVAGNLTVDLNEFDKFILSEGRDELTLVVNHLQRKPILVETGDGADRVRITFPTGVNPSQVLDGHGLTGRFKFGDLSDRDTVDLRSMGVDAIVTKRDHISEDEGLYLLAPGVKLDVIAGDRLVKTYNNYTDNWFVVKCGDETPYGPELIGDLDQGNFTI